MRHALFRIAVVVVPMVFAVSAFAVDCRTRKLTAEEQLDELTHPHREIARMNEVTTIQIALEDNLRALTKVRDYSRIEPMRTSVQLSRASLAYAKNICYPMSETEKKTLATMFVGVVAATENTDGKVIDQWVNRLQTTDKEKAIKKGVTIAARQAAGAAVGNAVGELTGQKVGEIVGKVVRGGPIGTAVGILLGASEIGPGDALSGPGAAPSPSASPVRDPSMRGGDHGHDGSIHDGHINDAPAGRTADAGRIAYIIIEPTAREKNNERIRAARVAINNAKH